MRPKSKEAPNPMIRSLAHNTRESRSLLFLLLCVCLRGGFARTDQVF